MAANDPINPKASLTDLPSELILERILPILSLRDLASLSATSKFLYTLCCDESLWSHKTQTDFSFTPSLLAPPPSSSGWSKRVYLGMRSPRTFVWGSTDNARLGTEDVHAVRGHGPNVRQLRRWVDEPFELTGKFPSSGMGRTWGEALKDSLSRGLGSLNEGGREGGGIGVVDLQAGGWSFTARDMDGGVWVWGQLDGTMIRIRAPSWEDKHYQVPEPSRIPLPCRAEAISAGRRHLLVLDGDNLIWELRAWGAAYHHTAASLTSPANPGSSSHPQHIMQLSTGWSHSACLTSSGTIHIWYPFSDGYEAALTPVEELHGPTGTDGDDDSRGLKWGTVSGSAVEQLDEIPTRPVWDDEWTEVETGDDVQTRSQLEDEWNEWTSTRMAKTLEEKERVVKIASGLDFVLALKGNGEVWYRRVNTRNISSWEYLPFFSSPTISHITAQYESITSYSTITSSVFHARLPANASPGFGSTLRPTPIPGLQGKGVIQVALGDYHYAALTSLGDLYTWGQGAQGQLGLGGTTNRGKTRVEEPEKVMFPGGEGCFVFGVTAAGWHTGALVLGDPKKKAEPIKEDLEEVVVDDGKDEKEKEETGMPGAFPRQGQVGNHVLPTAPIFRVGFAGRGAVMGHIGLRDHAMRYGTGTSRAPPE